MRDRTESALRRPGLRQGDGAPGQCLILSGSTEVTAGSVAGASGSGAGRAGSASGRRPRRRRRRRANDKPVSPHKPRGVPMKSCHRKDARP
jgi:hypothetical protein